MGWVLNPLLAAVVTRSSRSKWVIIVDQHTVLIKISLPQPILYFYLRVHLNHGNIKHVQHQIQSISFFYSWMLVRNDPKRTWRRVMPIGGFSIDVQKRVAYWPTTIQSGESAGQLTRASYGFFARMLHCLVTKNDAAQILLVSACFVLNFPIFWRV